MPWWTARALLTRGRRTDVPRIVHLLHLPRVIAGGDLQPFSQEATPLLRAASSRCCFAPLLEKAGLPTIRFHDLRHTCATLLLISNVSAKVVSEMPGHASIAITLGTYSRVLPTMQGGATRAPEDMLR